MPGNWYCCHIIKSAINYFDLTIKGWLAPFNEAIRWHFIPVVSHIESLFTYWPTHLRLLPFVEDHRPPTTILHPTLSWAILSSCFRLLLIHLVSVSNAQWNVFPGFHLLIFPSECQARAWLVTRLLDYRNYVLPNSSVFP